MFGFSQTRQGFVLDSPRFTKGDSRPHSVDYTRKDPLQGSVIYMLIKTIHVGHLDTNCYVVTDEKTLHCAVIDPGADANVILDYIEDNKLHVDAILITHGHFDHILAVPSLHEATGAPVYINKNDTYSGSIRDNMKYPADENTKFYATGDTVTVSGLTFEVFETPGHSPGSVTLRCGEALFTGDTLFRDSCGRTDLGEGNMDTLLHSLKLLDSLDGDYEVYPGHMDSTTLDRERKFNYYMKYARQEVHD